MRQSKTAKPLRTSECSPLVQLSTVPDRWSPSPCTSQMFVRIKPLLTEKLLRLYWLISQFAVHCRNYFTAGFPIAPWGMDQNIHQREILHKQNSGKVACVGAKLSSERLFARKSFRKKRTTNNVFKADAIWPLLQWKGKSRVRKFIQTILNIKNPSITDRIILDLGR